MPDDPKPAPPPQSGKVTINQSRVDVAVGFNTGVINYHAAPLTQHDRDRKALIQRIKHLLDQITFGADTEIQLDIQRTWVPRYVSAPRMHHWGDPDTFPDRTEPLTQLVLRVQRLLIIGPPGSGKSSALREIGYDLISMADDPLLPIPIVINLASFNRHTGDFHSWLMTQGMPESLGLGQQECQKLVSSQTLMLLLDGLDEVVAPARLACIRAINAFLNAGELGIPWIVVSSRAQEYVETAAQLALDAAIELHPLPSSVVTAALDALGNRAAGLRLALQRDPTLIPFLETPLMLNLAIKAYADMAVVDLHGQTTEERRHTLYTDFVRRMLRHGRRRTQYARQHTLRWLRWLATRMQAENATVFLVERMQPSWLTSLRRFQLLSGLAGGGIAQLLVLLTIAWGDITIANMSGRGRARVLMFGLLFGVVFGKRASTITPVEKLRWDWRVARVKLWTEMRDAWIIGPFVGLILGAIVGIITRSFSGFLIGFLGVAGILITALLVRTLIVSLHSGFTAALEHDPATPNAGIRASFWNGLLQSAVFMLGIGITSSVIGIGLGTGANISRSLSIAFTVGLVVGMGGGIGFSAHDGGLHIQLTGGLGEALKHYLLRFLIWIEGHGPIRFVYFLETCRALLFVRRYGGTYEFWHGTLREYFAALTDTEIRALVKSVDEP